MELGNSFLKGGHKYENIKSKCYKQKESAVMKYQNIK